MNFRDIWRLLWVLGYWRSLWILGILEIIVDFRDIGDYCGF